MVKTQIRRAPKRPLIQRVAQALHRVVGEISVLRQADGWTGQYSSSYSLNSSQVNYSMARGLYRNTLDNYKLGAGFAKPIINSTAGFMGAPHFTHVNKEGEQALEQVRQRWQGGFIRLNRNTLRDGDWYARIVRTASRFNPKEQQFDLQLIPPEWVTPIPNPITGHYQEMTISYPVTVPSKQKKQSYTVTEKITPTTRTMAVEGDAPAELRQQIESMQGTNPWGFIPVVHFKNEGEETALYGQSDLEPVEPFLKAYHDTMLHSVQGSRLFSRPKVRFSVRDVEQFIQDNFSAEEIRAGSLKFAGKEIFFMREGEDAQFITADTGLTGVTALLKFLFYCIVDVSETPEFTFGTAVQSSKASVSEQLLPFTRKIERKRGMFGEQYGELGSMFLAMTAKTENIALDTYQVDTVWDEISPRDDKAVADTIKAVVDGLTTAVESNMCSLEAASDFLREFVPTMLPWQNNDAESDELRRITEGAALRERLSDGQGWPGGEEN